jgi:hypothetical protein
MQTMNLAVSESLRQTYAMAVGISLSLDLIQEIGIGVQSTREQIGSLSATRR